MSMFGIPAVTNLVTPIVALDYSTAADALQMARKLEEHCTFFKVGSELFTTAGPSIVTALCDQGAQVFLDLKYHDIPNTVHKAAVSAARLGASLITVHASGGEAMIRAAVEGAGSACEVLTVTILTSLDASALASAWDRPGVVIEQEVRRLAGIAVQAGAAGVVCSGQEASMLQDQFGDRLKLLIPGIRLPDSPKDDQARTVTPQEAAAAGASYIILGRTVTQAPNPAAAMAQVLREIRSART